MATQIDNNQSKLFAVSIVIHYRFLMDTRSLECFVTVAQIGGVRAAARALNLTQPAVTTRIKRLEDEIGFPLFERRGRGIALSERGRLFLPRAIATVEAMAETRTSAALIRDGREGVLRIGYTAIGALSIVPPLLRAFKDARPEVLLELREMTSHPIERALARRELDAGILHPPVSEESLTLEPLTAYGFKAMLPKAHKLASARTLCLADIADEPFIMVGRHVGPAIFDRLMSCCLVAGFQPSIAQETDTSLSVLGLVAAGAGVGLVIEPIARFAHPDIRVIDLTDAMPTLGFAVASRGDVQNPLVEALVRVATRANLALTETT